MDANAKKQMVKRYYDQAWCTGKLAVVDELSPHADWDISDQLPYGDWRPGRWAWRLTDAEPVQSRPAPEVTRGNRQGVCEIEETW